MAAIHGNVYHGRNDHCGDNRHWNDSTGLLDLFSHRGNTAVAGVGDKHQRARLKKPCPCRLLLGKKEKQIPTARGERDRHRVRDEETKCDKGGRNDDDVRRTRAFHSAQHKPGYCQ
jgi:hypothetical protein